MAKAKKKDNVTLPRPRNLPAGHVLEENVRGFMNTPNVVAAFIGRKHRKGRDTGRLAIVCGVREKLSEEDLDRSHIIPKNHYVETMPACRTRIPTDVIPMSGHFRVHASVLGPSDIVGPGMQLQATVGIALRHPTFGRVITTAGHAIPQGSSPGASIIVQSDGNNFIAQLAAEPRINQATDHALLRPDAQDLVGNFFRDVTPLGPPYIPDPNHDVGRQLYVLPADRDIIPVVCRGLQGSVQVAPNLIMNDLIFTDQQTMGGDSGACLVDEKWRVWGLLLGAFPAVEGAEDGEFFSVFIPAFRILFIENAQYL